MNTRAAGPSSGVTLRLLDKADKEIFKLPRSVKGAIYDFQHKFKANPNSTGLKLQQLKSERRSGRSRLWSARVNDEYRALLLRLAESDWLIVSVRHRKEVYDNPDRLAYGINQITGGIEYVDLQVVEESVFRRTAAVPAAQAAPAGAPARPEPEKAPEPRRAAGPAVEPPAPLFAGWTARHLTGLGVAEPLVPVIESLTTEDQLLGLVEYAPQLTGEVLLALYDGKSYDEVLDQVTSPVTTPEPVDTEDYQAAVDRPSTMVTTTDDALREALEGGSFGRWKVFLHPAQDKLVSRDHSGPARVGGGPGTGKTIVALHRVKHLVEQLPPGRTKPVLLTTFNKNLAADLRSRLLELGGEELLSRVETTHVDQLALRVVREAEPGNAKQRIDDNQALREWQSMLDELDDHTLDAQFLHDEWNQVILGQAVVSRTEYFRARRAGRGRSIGRAERAAVWQLAERFVQRLDRMGKQTHRQVAERAARLEMERERRIEAVDRQREEAGGLDNIHLQAGSAGWLRHRYQHVVVDEAQDLNAAHWKMLRAMVPRGRNDLFLVGDTHQRIYDNHVTLGSLGVNIRGRSSKLTLSYRTTRQILGSALGVLSGERYDDLDGQEETLAGYRSVLSGGLPELCSSPTWEAERETVVDRIRAWGRPGSGAEPEEGGIPLEQIAVCVPTNKMAQDIGHSLQRAGIPFTEIGPDGPRSESGVHIGTMFRFKGLEYQRMIIAGVSEGLVPRADVARLAETDALRHRRELQRARSLLFVAATRSRDSLAISWHGTPSRFLEPLAGARK